MKKVLFHGLDGVLNTGRRHGQARGDELQDEYGYTFDPMELISTNSLTTGISNVWPSLNQSCEVSVLVPLTL